MSSSLTPEKPGDSEDGTRQDRREEKLRKKKERMKQHGKGLGKSYRDVVEKREKKKAAG
jgi:hypothetical protein